MVFDPFSFGLGVAQFGVSLYSQNKAKRRNKRATRKEQAFNNAELARQALETGREAGKTAQTARLMLGAAGVRTGAGTAASAAAISAESIRAQEEFTRQIDHSRQKGGFAHSGFLGSAAALQSARATQAKQQDMWRAIGQRPNDRIMKR
jgi:hypothetical protein